MKMKTLLTASLVAAMFAAPPSFAGDGASFDLTPSGLWTYLSEILSDRWGGYCGIPNCMLK